MKHATLALWATALLSAAARAATPPPSPCDRACLGALVDQVVHSMVAHDPDALPLAATYRATENSHPAALGMMALWRTVTRAHKPDFVALDVPAGQAFLLTQVSEGGDLSVLWGRIKVADRRITELELFVNRSRGDHGFSFSAERLPANMRPWMNPPAQRRHATRAELENLARLAFAATGDIPYEVGPRCAFIEAGSQVVDPGLDDVPTAAKDPEAPLGCFPPTVRPSDERARPLVIDEDLGVVVVGAIVPGTVFPYPFHGHMLSAFIPRQMQAPTDLQQQWYERKLAAGKGPLLAPMRGDGDTMEVYQVYDGQIQGHQINVHVGPEGMKSPWVK